MKEIDYLKYSEQILKELRKVNLFNNLDNNSVQAIASLCKFRKYQRGDCIIKEEEYDHWIYFLICGSVVIKKKGNLISKLQRIGDLFGEVTIIDGSPPSASVMANEDNTCCIVIDASILDRLEQESKMTIISQFYRMIAEAMGNKLRMANEEIIKLREDNSRLRNKLK